MDHAIDMKILRVIHILTMCGSVTRTAEVLSISPSAVSYMLGKARVLTGSKLFLRTKERMIPNEIAKDLSARYQKIAKELYTENREKEKLSVPDDKITISTHSLIEYILSGFFAKNTDISKQLSFVPLEDQEKQRLARLKSHEVNVDIGMRLPIDKSIVSVKLFAGNVRVVARKYHPTIRHAFTLSDWFNHKHIAWSRGMHYICDDYMHANNFHALLDRREIGIVSSTSLNMLNLCANSDYITLMPENLLRFVEDKFAITSFTPPEELTMRYECYLHYHYSLVQDESLNVILEQLKNEFSKV